MALGRCAKACLALFLLVPAPAFAATPPPITSGATGTSTAFASPHEIAFGALERLITPDHRLASDPTASIFFTYDQMLAVLVHLHRASLVPSQSSDALATAQDLWGAAESAYHNNGRFYDSSLTAAAVCVNLEANAWALLAADRLANATGRLDVRTRAADLAGMLVSTLASGSSSGVARCPDSVSPAALPLPLWALLLHHETVRDANSRTTAFAELDRELLSRFDEGFHDGSGFYLGVTNAQYLLVLQAAERISPGSYASERDALARFLGETLVRSVDGYDILRSAERRVGFAPTGGFDPVAQAWGAYALNAQRDLGSTVVGDRPERLLEGLMEQSWSTQMGAFVSDVGLPRATINALAALYTAGPVLTQTSAEGARVALVVPARHNFTYPHPAQASADDYLISNEWTLRFTLEPYGPTSQPVVIPLDRVGPVRHVFPQSPYAPSPQLQRSGTQVAATAEGTLYPLLRFNALLQQPTPYRLVDYAPVLPVESELRRDLRLFLTVNSTEPVNLDVLRLDVGISNVTVESVRFNDELLDPASFTGSEVSATEHVGFSHLRLELRGITLKQDLPNEVFASYIDLEGPTLGEPVLSSDAGGSSPLGGDPLERRYTVSTRGGGYVSVPVRDNAALRSVRVVVSQGADGVAEIPMASSSTEPDRYVALLPPLAPRVETTVIVEAVDEHGILSRSQPVTVVAQSPFLLEGNPVLLVFSGVLFVGAVVVWAKMGRRRRRA